MAEAAWTCLQACLSPDPAVQRPAEAQLRDWEAQPGFCSALAVRAARRRRSVARGRAHLRRRGAFRRPDAQSLFALRRMLSPRATPSTRRFASWRR
jgi:hypothetical protein